MVTADRTVAGQVDDLVAEYDPDSAIVVTDSAEDERLVPIVESRVPVDSVDRVVVRQARDLESTYYLMKQFLADEELRQTTLIPLGIALLVFPALAVFAGPAVAAAAIATVIGLFLLYKGLGVDDMLTRAVRQAQAAMYSGQVSVVTYVVAGGLTLVGVFAGALGISNQPEAEGYLLPAMRFAFDAVPWVAMAALTASAGRLLDEWLEDEGIRASYLNLPFVALAVGLVVRGFSAYFLQEAGTLAPMEVPRIELGVVTIEPFLLESGQRLALFVVSGVLVSLIGVRVAAHLGSSEVVGAEIDATESEPGERESDAEGETG
jgi:putative membrane protein